MEELKKLIQIYSNYLKRGLIEDEIEWLVESPRRVKIFEWMVRRSDEQERVSSGID